jgi:hypothetical protein
MSGDEATATGEKDLSHCVWYSIVLDSERICAECTYMYGPAGMLLCPSWVHADKWGNGSG